MRDNKQSLSSRMLLGLILIVVGGLFLLSTLNIITMDIPHIILSFPFFIFIIGLLIMIHSRQVGFGTILTVIGLIFLIPRIFPNIEINTSIIFPILIIALGFFIIFKRKSNPRDWHQRFHKSTISSDVIDEVSIFGGGERVIHTDNFKGGNITAIFGGSEIDLTKCKLAEGEQVIDMLSLFGGATILVPRDWVVRVQAAHIFGGFSNKIKRDPNQVLDYTRTLTITGTVIFGGGEIKYI